MLDKKSNKMFLKRTTTNIKLEDLYLGGIVNIFSRQMKVVDYVDVFTYKAFEKTKQKVIFTLSGSDIPYLGMVVHNLNTQGLRTTRLKLGILSSSAQAAAQSAGCSASGLTVVCEMVGEDAINKAKIALQGKGWFMQERKHWRSLDQNIFNIQTQCVFENPSVLLVKPHSIQEGNLGSALERLFNHPTLRVTGLQMFYLDRHTSEEFFEVYKGVLSEYTHICEHVSSGPCVVASVVSTEGSVVEQLRALAGPHDPEVAKWLYPESIRALYGTTKVKNCVHVTDLEEDGTLESE